MISLVLRIKFRFRGIRWLPTHTTLQNVISQRSSLLPSQQKLTTADTANLNSSDIFSAAYFADMLPIKLIVRKLDQKVDAIAYLGFYLSATQKGVIILPYKFLNHEESSDCNNILSFPPFGTL